MMDFFISYTQVDHAWAVWIAWQLEREGYSTVIQAWDFRPGSNFVVNMHGAAQAAHHTIAVLSEDYLVAKYTEPEWTAAFGDDPSGANRGLIPVRVKQCTPKGLLARVIYVDLVGLDEQAAADVLLTGIRPGRAKSLTQPPFPGPTTPTPSPPVFPGSVSTAWSVPHRRNPHFNGRVELLTQLDSSISQAQPVVLYGMAGTGKTQLIIEYAFSHAQAYTHVLWVPAENASVMSNSYAALCGLLGLPSELQHDPVLAQAAVRNWLDQHQGWLLIFDNALTPGDVTSYLPRVPHGHIVITSRNQAWGSIGRTLCVKEWSRAESVCFLVNRTRQHDPGSAARVAELLGDLPLVLEQAAAYVEGTGTPLAEYVDVYNNTQHDILPLGRSPLATTPIDTIWAISINQTPLAAQRLMHLCALLAPEPIPREFLKLYAKMMPWPHRRRAADALSVNAVVEALLRFSLVRIDPALSVHRLVQSTVRRQMGFADKVINTIWALRIVTEAFPAEPSAPVSWEQCAHWLAHALAVLEHSKRYRWATRLRLPLLKRVGEYLQVRGHYHAAHTVISELAALADSLFGSCVSLTANALADMAAIQFELGDWDASMRGYREVLNTLQLAHGDSSVIVRCRIGIGDLLRSQNKLADALAEYDAALDIVDRESGPESMMAAQCMGRIASVLKALGQFDDAWAHYSAALKIVERLYGPDSPEIAVCYNNLGTFFDATRTWDKAAIFYGKALAAQVFRYGPNHPALGTLYFNYGNVLYAKGEFERARVCYQKACEIDTLRHGANHPNVAFDLMRLGFTMEALAQADQAKQCFTEAYATAVRVLNPGHKHLLCLQHKLAGATT